MTGAPTLLRSILIYSICLPLAVLLGYLLATPLDPSTFATVGLVLFFLTIPLFLRWHHIWLIASWNLSAVLFFLPGRPALWLAMSALSLFIAVLQYILNPRLKFLHAPQVARPLIFLTIVILVTMKLTGGFNLGIFGGDLQGGQKYVVLLGGIMGYFALTSRAISPNRATLCVMLYFLANLSSVISEIAPVVAPSLYFIFLFFPVDPDTFQTMYPGTQSGSGILRLGGLAMASCSVFFVMLARYGIREIFSLRRLVKLGIFVSCVSLSMLGGFRSAMIMLMLTFATVFYLEGLLRSRLLPMFILLMIFGCAVLVPMATRLPMSMQRTLSFLPIEVDPIAKMSADSTSEWRVKMWKDVLPQIPQYLILGKGYSFNNKDLASISSAAHDPMEGAKLAGDYHNGPLSVILPFGIFGVIGFGWFLVASVKALHQNYQYGPAEYRQVNTLLLGYFIAKIIMFFAVFGAFSYELVTFTGLIGLSVSLNGGIAKPAAVPQPKIRLHGFRLQPTTRGPVGAV